MSSRDIPRHRTALVRSDLSRPLRLALSDGLLSTTTSVMDYGCGRGGDLRWLARQGFDCSGWDPQHAPEGARREADLVNLGYVINVIEKPSERREVLRNAWALARCVLVVSARLRAETPDVLTAEPYADGLVTRLGTFQKFFDQQELRAWIDQALDTTSVAAAPGVFYVFRDPGDRAAFGASRFRREAAAPRLRVGQRLFAEHRELLERLATFISDRGRLPAPEEFADYSQIVERLGSLKRAFLILRQASEPDAWEAVRGARSQDLLTYLALSRFDGRPKLGDLPIGMQRDVRAFFGTYLAACSTADELLRDLGQAEKRDKACRASTIGKQLPTAIYVHVDAIEQLPILLRLYEGCARAYVGRVDGSTVVKLGIGEPKVSYLSYPDFETDAHPALMESTSVHLQTFRVRQRRYDPLRNPPILHRKEDIVAPNHPRRATFARLTRLEEAKGLYADTSMIGSRDSWTRVLASAGWTLKGHRLVRV